jgi:hypothetical protein
LDVASNSEHPSRRTAIGTIGASVVAIAAAPAIAAQPSPVPVPQTVEPQDRRPLPRARPITQRGCL